MPEHPIQPISQEELRLIETELLVHLDALFNFAMHLTRFDAEESDDLVQEAYLKACRSISQYRQGTNAKAWLFTILKNTFINRYRERQRMPGSEDLEKVFFTGNEEKDGPQKVVDLRDELFNKALGDEVTAAIDALPPDFRTVIILCDMEEFSYEEIADLLEIPIGTVRSRLNRARNLLKDKLRDYANQQGFEDKRRKKSRDDNPTL
jgi:RNA polymerase sigma-70 factor (ECF subfamily)